MLLEKVPGLQLQNAIKAPIGFSGDDVYIIEQGYEGKDVVVKVSKRKEVYIEANNLHWLKQHIMVPTVYDFGKVDDIYYCIMEKLPGVMFQENTFDNPKSMIIEFSKALRRFHSIDYSKLPHNHSLKDKLMQIEMDYKNNKLTNTYFEKELQDKSVTEIYELLRSLDIIEDDLVLCHGDPCMPNIIVDSGNIGYIDVVGIGICDRYLDLSIAIRTLRYNIEMSGNEFTRGHVLLFLKSYGIKKFNKQKFIYYLLLDELIVG